MYWLLFVVFVFTVSVILMNALVKSSQMKYSRPVIAILFTSMLLAISTISYFVPILVLGLSTLFNDIFNKTLDFSIFKNAFETRLYIYVLVAFSLWKLIGNVILPKIALKNKLMRSNDLRLMGMILSNFLEVVLMVTPLLALVKGDISYEYMLAYISAYKIWDWVKEYWGIECSLLLTRKKLIEKNLIEE